MHTHTLVHTHIHLCFQYTADQAGMDQPESMEKKSRKQDSYYYVYSPDDEETSSDEEYDRGQEFFRGEGEDEHAPSE